MKFPSNQRMQSCELSLHERVGTAAFRQSDMKAITNDVLLHQGSEHLTEMLSGACVRIRSSGGHVPRSVNYSFSCSISKIRMFVLQLEKHD